MQGLNKKAAPVALAAIILGATTLALYWVFLVPILQAPDEANHLNYAFNLYSAGRLISTREPLHKWNDNLVGGHVWVEYLYRATNVDGIKFRLAAKVPEAYGTDQYYEMLDSNAPAEDSGRVNGLARIDYSLLTIYPCGYYALLACWLKAISLFSKHIVFLFFGARVLSVILLAINLFLIYLTLLELRSSRWMACLFTAIIAFFPMTSFVSSSVQADNLTLTMVMLSCLLALKAKRTFNTRAIVLLGIALGGLCLTKYHFFAAVFPPVLGLAIAQNLVFRRRVEWPRLMTALIAPACVAVLVQVWITHGSDTNVVLSNPSTTHIEMSRASAEGSIALAHFLFQGIGLAFSNFYLNGQSVLSGSTFNTFWGNFGWNDTLLVIFTPRFTHGLREAIAVVDVIVFVLTVLRLAQVTWRLIKVFRRGRRLRAMCIAFSNPLLNAYFLFTVMMFGLFMFVRNSFAPQGRNWFPLILAIFLTSCSYAPRALGRGKIFGGLSKVLIAGLVIYCIVGSYYAIPSIKNRYFNEHYKKLPYYGVCLPGPNLESLRTGSEATSFKDEYLDPPAPKNQPQLSDR